MGKKYKYTRKKFDEYIVISNEKETKHIVILKNAEGKIKFVKINSEILGVFIVSKKTKIAQKNEFDRHIEHSEMYENTLHKRNLKYQESIEDYVIKKATFEELHKAIKQLPAIQQQRIKKYYFDEKNEYQIAEEENTTQQAVNKSLILARKNLREILEKYYF